MSIRARSLLLSPTVSRSVHLRTLRPAYSSAKDDISHTLNCGERETAQNINPLTTVIEDHATNCSRATFYTEQLLNDRSLSAYQLQKRRSQHYKIWHGLRDCTISVREWKKEHPSEETDPHSSIWPVIPDATFLRLLYCALWFTGRDLACINRVPLWHRDNVPDLPPDVVVSNYSTPSPVVSNDVAIAREGLSIGLAVLDLPPDAVVQNHATAPPIALNDTALSREDMFVDLAMPDLPPAFVFPYHDLAPPVTLNKISLAQETLSTPGTRLGVCTKSSRP